jgi:hypothetical protein
MASYAAYGRLAALGYDPYTTTPHDALQGTHYYPLISASWQDTPSVYGPVATWIQAVAAHIGGERAWLTIWMLMVFNGIVFLAVGYLLLRTSDDPLRATLLWTANPLVIQQFVSGGHLDTYVAAGTICTLQLVRRGRSAMRDVAAGIALGITLGVKIDAGLVGLAVAWPLVRGGQWRRLTTVGVSCVVSAGGVYATYGVHVLAPLSAASKLVSIPSIWDVPWMVGRGFGAASVVCGVISVLWPVAFLGAVWVFGRRRYVGVFDCARYTVLIVIAWVIAAPWVMPWYCAPGWVALSQLPRNPLTRWLAGLTVFLGMAHNSGGHAW